MSLLSSLRTGVSGMNAQSTRILSVAENIANSSTTGFKRSRVEFESILGGNVGQYSSGSVASNVDVQITQQGVLSATGNANDLAINGRGFFLVEAIGGERLLTRSGAFQFDGSGRLVNTAGQQLLAYDLFAGGASSGTLGPVDLKAESILAVPSTSARFAANLPAGVEAISAASVPSGNTDDAKFSVKTSLVAFDRLGAPVTLDVYYTKTQPDVWEVAVFDRAGASNGTFPYLGGPLASGSLTFDASGRVNSGGALALAVPNGSSLSLDLSEMRQLAGAYSVLSSFVDGNAPAAPVRLSIGAAGLVETVYSNGARVPSFRIPIATVTSPDGLSRGPGGAFELRPEAGALLLREAGQDGAGSIVSGALEASTVDIASELTDMIEAQRNFTANSRVFQTSSELFDVLNRL